MDYQKFENHIAETLRHDEIHLDVDSFIQDLHRKDHKKRPIVFFWISGALAIFLGLAGLYIYTNDTPSNALNHHEAATVLSEKDSDVRKTETYQPNKYKNESSKSGALHAKVITQSVNNTTQVPHRQGGRQIYEDAQPQTITNQENTNYRQNQNAPDHSTTNQLNHLNKNEGTKEEIVASTSDNSADFIQVVASEVKTENASTQKSVINVSSIDNVPFSLSSQNATKLISGNIICPTFRKKGGYYLELIPEIGYFRPFKSLEQMTNEPDNVFALRKKNESTLEGINASFYLRMHRQKWPVFVQAGISTSRMTEKMPLDYSYIKRDTTQGIISITKSQTGDTLTIILGDIVKETAISGKKINHHHFTLIDFPISLGVEKRINEWTFGAEGGIVINASLSAKGQILVSDTSFTSVDAPFSAYKTGIGMSYTGGVFLSRDFNKLGRIMVSLRGRYIPEPFSSPQNRIRQSYHFLGLNVGYVYTF
jgi:hypothetical protein